MIHDQRTHDLPEVAGVYKPDSPAKREALAARAGALGLGPARAPSTAWRR